MSVSYDCGAESARAMPGVCGLSASIVDDVPETFVTLVDADDAIGVGDLTTVVPSYVSS